MRKTSRVSSLWRMYSWMPKLWIARPRCSAAAWPTGEMSVGPWKPDLIWYSAAKSMIVFRCVMPPVRVTALRTQSMSCSVMSVW